MAEQILGTPAVTLPDGRIQPARPGFDARLAQIEATQARIEANQERIDRRLADHIERHDDGVSVPNGVPDLRRRRR